MHWGMYESKQASKLASTPLRAQGVIPNLTVCETRKKKKAFYIHTYISKEYMQGCYPPFSFLLFGEWLFASGIVVFFDFSPFLPNNRVPTPLLQTRNNNNASQNKTATQGNGQGRTTIAQRSLLTLEKAFYAFVVLFWWNNGNKQKERKH